MIHLKRVCKYNVFYYFLSKSNTDKRKSSQIWIHKQGHGMGRPPRFFSTKKLTHAHIKVENKFLRRHLVPMWIFPVKVKTDTIIHYIPCLFSHCLTVKSHFCFCNVWNALETCLFDMKLEFCHSRVIFQVALRTRTSSWHYVQSELVSLDTTKLNSMWTISPNENLLPSSCHYTGKNVGWGQYWQHVKKAEVWGCFERNSSQPGKAFPNQTEIQKSLTTINELLNKRL